MTIENYEKFLEVINSDLKKIFDYQKEYIFCKEGCSLCCTKGNYPVSDLEADYLMIAYDQLDQDKKQEIKNRVKNIKNSDNFESYVCPFLFDNKCSIYSHRPFVCRSFGILTEDAQGNPSFPFCSAEGLNYSKIYDKEKKHLSYDLLLKYNFSVPPKFFKLSNETMMNLPLAKKLNLDFGHTGKLIEFLLKRGI